MPAKLSSKSLPLPKRIQRKRTRGWRLPENAVCVTRPGKWGNPWRVGVNPCEDGSEVEIETPAEAVKWYRMWLNNTPEGALIKRAARRELRGKNLACYCPLNKPCHADVLLEIANA